MTQTHTRTQTRNKIDPLDLAGIDDMLSPEEKAGKLNNVNKALEICRTSRTILGANRISLEFPVIRHMTNLESVLTYEGTAEIHTLMIGQALKGQAAYR